MRFAIFLMAPAICLIGCGPARVKPTATTTETTTPAVSKSTTPANNEVKKDSSEKTNKSASLPIKEQAEQFLARLSKGEAKTSELSAAFKKQITRPRNTEEKALGYSDSLAHDWLDKLAGATYKSNSNFSQLTNQYTLMGTVTGGPKTEYFVLRMVMLPGKTPEVNWFHRSNLRAGDRTAQASPDVDAARDFLEVAGSGQETLTASLLTPEFRAKIAEPLSSDKEFGYNIGMLNLKIKAWRATAITMTVGNDLGTFSGELINGDQKKSYKLKLVNKDGNWLVESFEVQ